MMKKSWIYYYSLPYTIKLTFRDQDYNNCNSKMKDKDHYFCHYDKIYLHFIDVGGLE